MAYYTIYGLGPKGAIKGAMSICFDDEADALAFAEQQLDKWPSVEIWVADRLIGTLVASVAA